MVNALEIVSLLVYVNFCFLIMTRDILAWSLGRKVHRFTQDENKAHAALRVVKSANRQILINRILHVWAYCAVVCIPLHMALYSTKAIHWNPAYGIFDVLLHIYWTYVAWKIVKDDKPKWKKRKQRVLEKIKALQGRLVVVPV